MNEPESKKTTICRYLYLYRLVAPEIGTKVDPGDPTHRDVPGYVELLAEDLLDLKKVEENVGKMIDHRPKVIKLFYSVNFQCS
jgi:hypothetical protein